MSVPAAVTQFFSMMAYRVVEVYVAIYAVLHRLPGGGIYFIGIAVTTVATRILLGRVVDKYGEARLVYRMLPLSPGYFYWYSRTTYRRPRCWDTASEPCSLPCRPWHAYHACRKTRCCKLHVLRGFRFRDCIERIFAGLLVKYRGYNDMFLAMLLASLLSIIYYYLFGCRHPSSFIPPPKKRIRHEPDNA